MTDTETGGNVKTIQPSMMERVYAALADNQATTAQELAAMIGATAVQTGKCLQALVCAGRARPLGKRPCKITRRWMTYWRTMA
jgi:hypothetical protein